jgi:uncharacterized delta-60 repeat protein
MLRKRLLMGILGCVVALSISTTASAYPGQLDTTYSGDGLTRAGFATSSHLAVDGQGRVLIGGQVLPGSLDAGKPSLMRYTSSGRLDSTFDGDGKMSLPVDARVLGLGLQGTSIVAASETSLWRLTNSGAMDATFGSNGRVAFPTGYTPVGGENDQGAHPVLTTSDRIYVLLKQPLAAPYTGDNHPEYLAMYSATGEPLTMQQFPSYLQDVTSLALYRGYVYVVGSLYDTNSAARVTVVRFSASTGIFDSTYNGGRGAAFGPAIIYDEFGYVTSYYPRDIAVHQVSGKVTVVGGKYACSGSSCSSSGSGFALRFKAAGPLDGTFGTGGEARAGCTDSQIGMKAVALQGKKTIAGGTGRDTNDDGLHRFSVTRLTISGSRDGTFNSGACSNALGTEGAWIEDLALAGGKIVAVGGRYTARYTT